MASKASTIRHPSLKWVNGAGWPIAKDMNKVSVFQSFHDLPEHYEKAFADGTRRTGVFTSLAWFQNLEATVLRENGSLRIYSVESDVSDEAPSLVLPMYLFAESPRSGSIRKLAAAGNYYTPLFSPVCADGSPKASDDLKQLIRFMVSQRPRWDVVDMHPLDPETTLFADLLSAFRQAGMQTDSYACFGNWYLRVNGRCYDEYFASLPSRLRNTLKRKSGRLDQEMRLRTEIITDEAGLNQGIANFEAVYKSSWKNPEPYPHFIPGLIRACAKEGWLRLGIAYIDGHAAAAQFWIVHGNVASIYKLAYDERFSNWSVGSILTSRLMQHVLDKDRVDEVDFLSGDDPYKRDWMSHRRERRGIIAFSRRTWPGLLGASLHLAGTIRKSLKNLGRQQPGPHDTI